MKSISQMGQMGLSYEAVQLEAIRVYAQERLPRIVRESMELAHYVDMASDHLVMALSAQVYGKRQSAEQETFANYAWFDTPATWWQAFKLAAINAGNPFFDPKKIRMTTHKKMVAVQVRPERFIHWPEFDFPVPTSWGRPITIALLPTIDWLEFDRG